MFFNGVTCHQNRIGRSLPVGNLAQPVSIPQGEHSAAHTFLGVFVKSCGWISRKFNRERPVDSGFLDFDRRSDFVRESEMIPQARYWRRRGKNFGYCNEAAAVA